jgi:hypothetical protein
MTARNQRIPAVDAAGGIIEIILGSNGKRVPAEFLAARSGRDLFSSIEPTGRIT